MNILLQALVRRAILDLMAQIGGEQNHRVLTMLLNELGHRVAERDVKEQLGWLQEKQLIATEELEHFFVARILADGRDVAAGRLNMDGISIFKSVD